MPKRTAPNNIPSLDTKTLDISNFLGVDFSNAPVNVANNRSPDAVNMISDLAGYPVKRKGFSPLTPAYSGHGNIHSGMKWTDNFTSAIYKESIWLTHFGTNLSYRTTGAVSIAGILKNNVANNKSRFMFFNNMVLFLDGTSIYTLKADSTRPGSSISDKIVLQKLEDIAYIPTVSISRSHSGGGTQFEAVNLIGEGFTDSFLGEVGEDDYQLSFDSLLSAKGTVVKVMQPDATWATLVEGTDYSVDYLLGIVHFDSPPGASPLTGYDNIEVTAYKDFGMSDLINKCTFGALFGVGGETDRLFLSGNPDYPNYDWYSAQNDPTYFGDLWYSVLGQNQSKITGYSVLGNKLATHKDNAEDGRNVIVRSGEMLNGQASFPIVNVLQGEGAINPWAFGYLGTEPMFLTSQGVYALTPADLTGEKYSQNRSFFINTLLKGYSESELMTAVGCNWDRYFVLAIGKKVFLLDGNQKHYEKNQPYSNFQYECYYWEVPFTVTSAWNEDGILCLGTYDYIMRLNTEDSYVQVEANRYCDYSYDIIEQTGEYIPVSAHWDFPDFSGKLFYQNKTIRYTAVRLASAQNTGFTLYAQVRGLWSEIYRNYAKARFLLFSKLIFSKFTFSSDKTPRTIGKKIKIKKVDKVRFRVENAEAEPFGLYEFAIEYTERGKYRR